MANLRPALVLFLLFTVLSGIAYPALITGVAQAAMPWQANGSLIVAEDGTALGSELIGQPFDDEKYFWSRPSATGSHPYDGGASSGSNQGPTNPALLEAVQARVAALHAVDPGNDAAIPVDLVTASGSGLDPHISPAAAVYQLPRVARARGMSEDAVRDLVDEHTTGRFLGLLGEPGVNVLLLNRALDRDEDTR